MARDVTVSWAGAPTGHDYPAAESFLRLTAAPALVDVLTALFSQAPTVRHRAKDILRAARLQLLPADDPEVAKDLKHAVGGQVKLQVRGQPGPRWWPRKVQVHGQLVTD
jgi:hypothetical protein